MAYVEMERYGAFSILPDDHDPNDSDGGTYIQSDWDYPGVASAMGWQACECGETDGTIDCDHRTARDMIAEAFEWIDEREGERFEALDEYLTAKD